jgi:hypothetical protein
VEQKKSSKHLLWDCPFSQIAWKNLNSILDFKKLGLDKVVSYDKIFDFGGTAYASLIIVKIIN